MADKVVSIPETWSTSCLTQQESTIPSSSIHVQIYKARDLDSIQLPSIVVKTKWINACKYL